MLFNYLSKSSVNCILGDCKALINKMLQLTANIIIIVKTDYHMEVFKKITDSGQQEYINSLIKNGASFREVSEKLHEIGISISHSYISRYAKAKGLQKEKEIIVEVDSNTVPELPSVEGMNMEDVLDLMGQEIKAHALMVASSREYMKTIQQLKFARSMISTSLGAIKTLQEVVRASELYIEIKNSYNEERRVSDVRRKHDELDNEFIDKTREEIKEMYIGKDEENMSENEEWELSENAAYTAEQNKKESEREKKELTRESREDPLYNERVKNAHNSKQKHS